MPHILSRWGYQISIYFFAVKCAKIIKRLYESRVPGFSILATVVQFDAVALISSTLIKIFKRTVEKLKTRSLGFTQNSRRVEGREQKTRHQFQQFRLYKQRWSQRALRGAKNYWLVVRSRRTKWSLAHMRGVLGKIWFGGVLAAGPGSLSVLAYFKRCANGSHILIGEFISRSWTGGGWPILQAT